MSDELTEAMSLEDFAAGLGMQHVLENHNQRWPSVMQGLTLEERVRVYRQSQRMLDATEVDPAMRSIILMAAQGLAVREGATSVGRTYVGAMQAQNYYSKAKRDRVAADLARIDRERTARQDGQVAGVNWDKGRGKA